MSGINNKQLLILRAEGKDFGYAGEPSGYAKLEERGNRLLLQFGAQDLKPLSKGRYISVLYFSGNDKTFLFEHMAFDASGNGILKESLEMRELKPSSVIAAGIMYIEHGFLYPVLCGHKGGGFSWLTELINGACAVSGTKRGGEYTNWEYQPMAETEASGRTEQAEKDLKHITDQLTAAAPIPKPEEPAQVQAEPGEKHIHTVFGDTTDQMEFLFEKPKEVNSYFECNAESFERLLRENEPVEGLNDLIPGSEWVRVEYNDQDSHGHYIMGIIYDAEHKPLYICYGIPGKYAPLPPENIKGFCQWIPEKPDQPQENGYWMMYQNAVTGERFEEI